VKRALTPATNPTGLASAAAAIYAAVVMIWNAVSHHGVIDPQVIVAALAAAAFLYSRMKVTPTADPKDGNGQPLVAAPAAVPPQGSPAAQIARGRAYIAETYGNPDPPAAPPGKTLQPPAVPE